MNVLLIVVKIIMKQTNVADVARTQLAHSNAAAYVTPLILYLPTTNY
jgi:hypothetical protein